LDEILKYYKQYLPKTKKEEIISIEHIINNNSDNYEYYLKDYKIAKEINLKAPLISLLGKFNDDEKQIELALERWKKIEKMLFDKTYKRMRGDYKKRLINFFRNKNNKEIIIRIFNEDIYDSFIEKNNIEVEEEQEDNIQNNNISYNIMKVKDEIINNLHNKYINPLHEKFQKGQDSKNANIFDSKNNEYSFNLLKSEESEKEMKSIEYNKTKEEIAEFILKESKFRFHTNKNLEEMTFIYDQIIIVLKNYNILVDYEQLQSCKEYFLKNKIETVLAKSFLKLMDFKDELEKSIRNEFMYNYNLKIELAFQRVDNEERENEIYDIQCIYTFFHPDDDNKECYKDENILFNKTLSKLQGFCYLLGSINNAKYNNSIILDEDNRKNKKALFSKYRLG
jgi:hypothetical protein